MSASSPNTLTLQWKAKSIAPHRKQREAKWVFSTAIYSITAQLPDQVYSKLLLFTVLLVFVDETE